MLCVGYRAEQLHLNAVSTVLTWWYVVCILIRRISIRVVIRIVHHVERNAADRSSSMKESYEVLVCILLPYSLLSRLSAHVTACLLTYNTNVLLFQYCKNYRHMCKMYYCSALTWKPWDLFFAFFFFCFIKHCRMCFCHPLVRSVIVSSTREFLLEPTKSKVRGVRTTFLC